MSGSTGKGKPTLLTGPEFVSVLQQHGIPPMFEEPPNGAQPDGLRVFWSGLLPHPGEGDQEIDAWVYPDGLILVSKRIFRAMGGKAKGPYDRDI